jgi:hypothetical protein
MVAFSLGKSRFSHHGAQLARGSFNGCQSNKKKQFLLRSSFSEFNFLFLPPLVAARNQDTKWYQIYLQHPNKMCDHINLSFCMDF